MPAEESGSQPETGGGLFNSVKTMVSTLLAIVQTRAELLSTELEEERIRLTSMLAWGFVTLLFVLALWDDHRLLAVGIPAAVFLLAAFAAARVAASKAQAKPKLFSASLAELARDRERLNPPS